MIVTYKTIRDLAMEACRVLNTNFSAFVASALIRELANNEHLVMWRRMRAITSTQHDAVLRVVLAEQELASAKADLLSGYSP